MTIDLFQRILGKLQKEMRVREVWLGGYSEPLLHPHVEEFIVEINRRGLRSCVSTNLTEWRGMDRLLAAHPSYLRVSISGLSASTYGFYHGGDIEKVMNNIRRLAQEQPRISPETFAVVFFHRYRDNQKELYAAEKIVRGLGLHFDWCDAFFRPAERLLDYLNGPVSMRESVLMQRLTEPVRETLAKARRIKSPCRSHYKQIEIKADGTMALCCHAPLSDLPLDYLATPLRAIRKTQRTHNFCDKCMANSLHILYNHNEAIKRG